MRSSRFGEQLLGTEQECIRFNLVSRVDIRNQQFGDQVQTTPRIVPPGK
jgi:hypothetical protein